MGTRFYFKRADSEQNQEVDPVDFRALVSLLLVPPLSPPPLLTGIDVLVGRGIPVRGRILESGRVALVLTSCVNY